MPPDFLLRCTGCGREAVWDTEAYPPVGVPEVGHPVLWRCDACGGEQRHIVNELLVITDKLHHEICVATEIDRRTVERVMGEVCRYRDHTGEGRPTAPRDPTVAINAVANAIGVSRDLVEQIAEAEATWMRHRGYPFAGRFGS